MNGFISICRVLFEQITCFIYFIQNRNNTVYNSEPEFASCIEQCALEMLNFVYRIMYFGLSAWESRKQQRQGYEYNNINTTYRQYLRQKKNVFLFYAKPFWQVSIKKVRSIFLRHLFISYPLVLTIIWYHISSASNHQEHVSCERHIDN